MEESGDSAKERAGEKLSPVPGGPGAGVSSRMRKNQIEQHSENCSNESLDTSAVQPRQDGTTLEFQQE